MTIQTEQNRQIFFFSKYQLRKICTISKLWYTDNPYAGKSSYHKIIWNFSKEKQFIRRILNFSNYRNYFIEKCSNEIEFQAKSKFQQTKIKINLLQTFSFFIRILSDQIKRVLKYLIFGLSSTLKIQLETKRVTNPYDKI